MMNGRSGARGEVTSPVGANTNTNTTNSTAENSTPPLSSSSSQKVLLHNGNGVPEHARGPAAGRNNNNFRNNNNIRGQDRHMVSSLVVSIQCHSNL